MKTLALLFQLNCALLIAGCAANRPTTFVHPEYDFSTVERIAIIPFENLSTEQGTGGYMTRVFMTELLATGAFDIVEPGEVARVLSTIGQIRTAELDLSQLKKLGDELKVHAVIFGSVGESSQYRGGSGSSHLISVDARMVDCQSGTTVWTSSVSTGTPGALAKLSGTGDYTRGEAIRKAVKKLVHSLVR